MAQLTRRSWLQKAGRLAASFLPLGKPGGVRFSVRSPLPPGLTLRDRALLLRRLGFDGIERGDEWTAQPLDRIQTQLDGTGIAVSAVVGSLQLLNTDPTKRQQAITIDRQQLEKARQLGAAGVIEVPVFGENQFSDRSPHQSARQVEEDLLRAELKELAPAVQRSGVFLLLEPCNRKETHFLNTQAYGAELIERVAAPGFRLLSDFYHMQIEEKDIVQTLASVGNRTGYVHLADGRQRTEPGSLPFDYRPGFRALKQWHYAGWLTIECRATDNPEAALRRALAYVKQQWTEA
jgi:sugar phosphate isomerase/epimerase